MCPRQIGQLKELDLEALSRAWVTLDAWPVLDADDFEVLCDPELWAKMCAVDFEYFSPGGRFQGLGGLPEKYAELRRSIPDLSVTVREVTTGPNTAEVIHAVSGTLVQSAETVLLFPIGQFVEWILVSSLTFNEAGLISKEYVHVSLNALPSPSRPVCDGIAESACALASTKLGSQLLQEAIGRTARVDLLEQLRGGIPAAARCPHANHVLQAYIVAMPPEAAQFIVDGLRGHAVAAALHQSACRVLQRLLEHCPQQQVAPLVEELLQGVQDLVAHRFGNFVAQRLLEHGADDVRRRVANAICFGDAKFLARHWVSNNVVRCAFLHCAPEDRARLAHAIAPDALELAKVSKHRHGSFLFRDIKLALRCKSQ